ncbi:MAG TPA: AAA family ATPase, partial [Pilimelia sp.]|nr:AAA family ATPase [Pilimelia sp.]
MALLLDSVARVPSAGLVAVVVAGEAGIGKSHLLDEATAELRRRGWRVVSVRADRLERQVPYAALGTAVRGLAVDSSFAADVRRAALAALDVPATDLADTTAAPGAVFGRACATVTRLLTALTAAGPVVLAVDDLHELDDDSLALLAVVVRRLSSAPVAFVAALRPHVAAPNAAADELIERLAERGDVVRVELSALSPGDLGTLVTPILGGRPDDNLAGEVHRRADGNPFFAAEIARSLADSHLLAVDGEQARLAVAPGTIPLTRRSAVLRRVVPLAAEPLAVARTLAVLRSAGLERIGLIAEVAGLSEAAVAAAFDDLVRAHVVTHDPERGYRFVHDIVADALYDDIGPAQCRQLHRAVAERLLAGRGGGRADLLELAWHVSESAVPGDAVAVEVLTGAARRSLTSAPEAAAGFCARALALLDEAAPERAALLALHCRALARASRPAVAVPPGRVALALLPPGEERSRTATAMLGSLFSLGRIDEAIEVVDEQVATGPAPAALRAQRAVLLVFANRTAEGLREAEAAAAIPPASPAEEVVVQAQLTILTSMLFRHDETVAHADRALAAAG